MSSTVRGQDLQLEGPISRAPSFFKLTAALTHSSLFGTLPSTQTQLVPFTQTALGCNLESVLGEWDSVCVRLIPKVPKVPEHVGTQDHLAQVLHTLPWKARQWTSSPHLTLLLQ